MNSLRPRVLLAAVSALMIVSTLNTGFTLTATDDRPLVVVDAVDLKRYMGRWYEVARYPNRWQRGLVGVTAHYALEDDGDIDVTNRGRKGSLRGAVEETDAKAWVVCEKTRAKWYVQFIWPFKADYWIIDLDEDYRYAVVGQPSRNHLWVLCREPEMDDKTYKEICARLARQGYDPDRLRRTPQRPTRPSRR